MNNWKIDSINFKNAIIQLKQLPFELPEFAKDIKEMIIEEWFGNYYYGNLVIEKYPNLEKIIVKSDSLKNLNLLKICDNEKLKTIEIESYAFKNVKNVIVESNWLSDYFIFSNLPNLQSFITGDGSFWLTRSLSLSSRIIKLSINQLDVPFTNGEFNTERAFMNMNVDDIECDESIVVNE